MKTKNPFEYGSGLRAETLVDREKEVAEVINTITEGGKLFLMGPRRYGKTSILKAAQAKAIEQKAVVLRFNAEAYATLEELISAVLSNATSQLNTNLNKTREKVKGFFGNLKPELTFDLSSQTVSAKSVRKLILATNPNRFHCWSKPSMAWKIWRRSHGKRSG